MSDTTTLGMPIVVEPRAPRRNGEAYFIRTFGCQMNEHDSERIYLCPAKQSPAQAMSHVNHHDQDILDSHW